MSVVPAAHETEVGGALESQTQMLRKIVLIRIIVNWTHPNLGRGHLS